MGILTWIVLGLIVGAIAKLIMPGRDPGGIIVTSLLGIGGAFLGGSIASFLGIGSFTGFNLGSIVIAVLGAILILAIYGTLARPRESGPAQRRMACSADLNESVTRYVRRQTTPT